MKKQKITKIIGSIFMLIFVFSVFLPISFSEAKTTTTIGDLYSNPNQENNNLYKFKISDVVNSTLLTNVVGCTGVVDKVATWMSSIVQGPAQTAKLAKEAIAKKKEQLKQACASVKAASESAGQSIVQIGGLAKPIDTALSKMPSCRDRIEAMDDESIQYMIDEEKATTARDYKEQCFDGIAITLARNQLTSMTRSAMNWINSGYGGNPFFVKNMTNFTNNIENNVIETGIDVLLSPSNKNPYATNFANSIISSRSIDSSITSALSNLSSDLENFVTDPKSYYSNDQLSDANDTRTALQRAQDANDVFAGNFLSGGWDAWLALTQKPQNNPLGYTLIASQKLADESTRQVQEKKDELTQNGGFLTQEKCIEYKTPEEIAREYYNENYEGKAGYENYTWDNYVQENYPAGFDTTEVCTEKEKVTPGSIIKDKVSSYITSSERQLELAKTINDSLNALFSVLLDKLESNGLSGLADSTVTTDWIDTTNTYTSGDGNTTYDNNDAYSGFNLTKDLGNTYIHDNTTELGTWNAQTNRINTDEPKTYNTQLHPDLAPIKNYDSNDEPVYADSYSYYTVTQSGKTELVKDGANIWEVGDRAFWDGEKWQNWKCQANKNGICTKQLSPIKNKGVIQIQQDFVVAAKDLLGVLPSVMPKLGELDYCIPGPNPSYKTNSTDTQSAYQSWIGSMYVGPRDEHRTEWRIDHEDSDTYKTLANIFSDVPNVWKSLSNNDSDVLKTERGPMWLLDDFDRQWGLIEYCLVHDGIDDTSSKAKNMYRTKQCQNYHYDASEDSDELDDIDDRKAVMNKNLDYVNYSLFENFYDVFDKMINNLYFNNLTSKYLEREDRIVDITKDTDYNSAYIPMASAGYGFTKDIRTYSDDNEEAISDYTEAVTQAKINIAKLQPIQIEVSKIIKAAQNRRDEAYLKILNDESVRTGRKDGNGNPYVLTLDKYKEIYSSCLDEENISFFDAEDLSESSNSVGERCFDGIDNDFDKLIDNKDPDCDNVEQDKESNYANGCFDETDNDGDGLTDLRDGDCSAYRQKENNLDLCTDGFDNDGDGRIDTEDPKCPNYGKKLTL